ncbi:hypothetical protein AB1N83_004417 [Pleurotus pulmonarius]
MLAEKQEVSYLNVKYYLEYHCGGTCDSPNGLSVRGCSPVRYYQPLDYVWPSDLTLTIRPYFALADVPRYAAIRFHGFGFLLIPKLSRVPVMYVPKPTGRQESPVIWFLILILLPEDKNERLICYAVGHKLF